MKRYANHVIKKDDIRIGELLAQGAQGALFVGILHGTTPIALKLFSMSLFGQDDAGLQDFETELRMLV
jgi:hypothetical protein